MKNYKQLYCIKGTVIHGRGIGKLMEMPTANLKCEDNELPPVGVYISLIFWNGTRYIGVTHIGTRPTVDNDKDISVETHLLRFDGDLYGEQIEVQLLKMLREPIKFSSASQLREQFYCDCNEAVNFFKADGCFSIGYETKIIVAGELHIDKKNRVVLVKDNQINLTPKEFEVLVSLVDMRNCAVSRNHLYEKVWKEDANGYFHQIENVISQLRKKIDWENISSGRIITVTGYGYKFQTK